MLVIFGGLPGVGKSTIAKKLAHKLKAVYLRIDTIEQALKDVSASGIKAIEVTAEGYFTACAIAKDNLQIGLTVITDSVNPIELTRHAYRKIARDTNANYLEVEIVCSDKVEHQQRIETRPTTIPGLKLPTWNDVLLREYEFWHTKNISIDTALTKPDQAVNDIIALL